MKKFRQAGDVKVGVIGYGGAFNMGSHHLREMQGAGMTPCAVCEIDPERLKAASADFPGIGLYGSVKEMLKKSDVDLLTVITPHNTHASIAMECLKAGRHVVCEKPMAVSTKECEAMIAAAKKGGAMLSVYHNRHWDGCIMKAVQEIRGGAIGDVLRVEAHMGGWGQPLDWWRSSKTISGGVLFDWGAHLLEYTFQIIDAKLKDVTGFAVDGVWAGKTKWKADTNEDEAFAVIRYADGRWSSLMISQLDCNPKQGIMEIMGTRGSYVMDHGTWRIVTDTGDARVTRTGRNPRSEGARYYANVAKHLVGGEPLVITAELGRRIIHVLDLAGRSARKGATVPVKYA